MKIDPSKFVTDESRSNPRVVAQVYPDCPIKQENRVCVYMAIGFGTPMEPCEHLFSDSESISCHHPDKGNGSEWAVTDKK